VGHDARLTAVLLHLNQFTLARAGHFSITAPEYHITSIVTSSIGSATFAVNC
jgi:hypothetical protein